MFLLGYLKAQVHFLTLLTMTHMTTISLTRQVLALEAGQVVILVLIHLELELCPVIRLEKEWGQIQV